MGTVLVGAEEGARASWELTGHIHSGESPRPLSIPTSHTHLYCQPHAFFLSWRDGVPGTVTRGLSRVAAMRSKRLTDGDQEETQTSSSFCLGKCNFLF